MTGLKTCRPAKRSARPEAPARSSIDSEEVVLERIASLGQVRHEALEQGDLVVALLHDRLDDVGGVLAEAAEVGRDLDVGGDLPAAALDQLGDPPAGLLGRRVRARPQDDLAPAGGHCGQATGDRAASDDAQTLID